MSKLKCPECDYHSTAVIDSRPINNNQGVKRRRRCFSCNYRFSTKEFFGEPGIVDVAGAKWVVNFRKTKTEDEQLDGGTLYFGGMTVDSFGGQIIMSGRDDAFKFDSEEEAREMFKAIPLFKDKPQNINFIPIYC